MTPNLVAKTAFQNANFYEKTSGKLPPLPAAILGVDSPICDNELKHAPR
jgi:hypothetical protein